jgi:hypothetical protein
MTIYRSRLSFAAISSYALLISSPASACMGITLEHYIISRHAPDIVPPNTIVLEIQLKKKPDPYKLFWDSKPIKADVLKVLSGSYKESIVTIEILQKQMSSCDRLAPMTEGGVSFLQRGFIMGTTFLNAKGATIFSPVRFTAKNYKILTNSSPR